MEELLAQRPQTRGTPEYAGWQASLTKTERIALKEHRKAQKIAANGGVNPDARWNAPEKLRECQNCHKMHVIGGQAERECLALIAEYSPSQGTNEAPVGVPSNVVYIFSREVLTAWAQRHQRPDEIAPPNPVVLSSSEANAEMLSRANAPEERGTEPDSSGEEPMPRSKNTILHGPPPSTRCTRDRDHPPRKVAKWPELELGDMVFTTNGRNPRVYRIGYVTDPVEQKVQFDDGWHSTVAQVYHYTTPDEYERSWAEHGTTKRRHPKENPGNVGLMPPPKKTNPIKKAPEVSKSQYIRDRAHLTPAETIAEAKKAGITLTSAMVYSVRSDAKKRSAKTGTPKATKQVAAQPAPKGLRSRVSVEVADEDLDTVRRLLREYGTRALRAMLDQIERE